MITIVEKWYNKIGSKTGALNPCIYANGKTASDSFNTLPNCTAFCTGAFNYYHGLSNCRYFGDTNAVNYYTRGQNQGLKVGQVPIVGSVMVWSGGSSGAGHCAFVERIDSGTKIYAAESGWNSSNLYWNQVYNYSNGEWKSSWMSSSYHFLGFVYPPYYDPNKKKKKFPWVLLANKIRDNK